MKTSILLNIVLAGFTTFSLMSCEEEQEAVVDPCNVEYSYAEGNSWITGEIINSNASGFKTVKEVEKWADGDEVFYVFKLESSGRNAGEERVVYTCTGSPINQISADRWEEFRESNFKTKLFISRAYKK